MSPFDWIGKMQSDLALERMENRRAIYYYLNRIIKTNNECELDKKKYKIMS